MSADVDKGHGAELGGQDGGHGNGHANGGSRHHGSFSDYLIGLAFSIPLTAIPFWMVIDNVFREPQVAAIVLMIFAVVQIVVHVVFFLHLNTGSEGGWTVLSLIFTVVLVVITLSGSLWIMQHLNSNMMPGMSPQQARSLP